MLDVMPLEVRTVNVQVLEENSNVSEDNGLGFFIDFDDLLQISGVSGKSKPGVTAKHLSKI